MDRKCSNKNGEESSKKNPTSPPFRTNISCTMHKRYARLYKGENLSVLRMTQKLYREIIIIYGVYVKYSYCKHFIVTKFDVIFFIQY